MDIHPRLLSLLAECKEHPEDDAPRLVLADWLQEHGETEAERARGELIHLQCRLARLPEGDPGREEAARREQVLRWKHEWDWLGPWQGATSGPRRWWRGLLWVRVKGVGWLKGALLRPDSWAWLGALHVYPMQPRSAPRLARTRGLIRQV